jgi:hypothetical protein
MDAENRRRNRLASRDLLAMNTTQVNSPENAAKAE